MRLLLHRRAKAPDIAAGPAELLSPYLIVSPAGNDTTGTGTLAAPFATIQRAHTAASAGTTIYVRAGQYDILQAIKLTKSGTATSPMRLYAYPGEFPVVNGSTITVAGAYCDSWCLWMLGASYWHIRDIEFRNGREGGVILDDGCTNNWIERLKVHHCGWDSQWEGKGITVWGTAANNLISNCDSYSNYDLNETNADGFSLPCTGTGNIVRGCRAWWNANDGFSARADIDNVPQGAVTFEHCWAYRNGYKNEGTTATFATAHGFRLGGRNSGSTAISGAHVLKNCMAWMNRGIGFVDNVADSALTFDQCTAYANVQHGFVTNTSTPNHTLRHCAALSNNSNGVQFLKKTGDTSFRNSWDGIVSLTTADFESLSDTVAMGPRQANGHLPVGSFLYPAASSDLIDSGNDVGATQYFGMNTDVGAMERIFPVTAWSTSDPTWTRYAWGKRQESPSGMGRFRIVNSLKTWSFASTDGNEITIEVRPGDIYNGDPTTSERSEIGIVDFLPVGKDIEIAYEFNLTSASVNTSPWMVLNQFFAEGAGGSPPIAMNLEGNDRLRIITRTDASGSTVETYRYTAASNITRNAWHTARWQFRVARNGTAFLKVTIDGTVVVDLTGINIGYSGQTGVGCYCSIYRSAVSQTQQVKFRNLEIFP